MEWRSELKDIFYFEQWEVLQNSVVQTTETAIIRMSMPKVMKRHC